MKNKTICCRGYFAIMLLCACVLFSACGKSEAVKAAEAQIRQIGEVSLGSASAIESAENAIQALSEEDLKTVGNMQILQDARQKLNDLRCEDFIAFCDSNPYPTNPRDYAVESLIDIALIEQYAEKLKKWKIMAYLRNSVRN